MLKSTNSDQHGDAEKDSSHHGSFSETLCVNLVALGHGKRLTIEEIFAHVRIKRRKG
jgi:hypothetical protein